MEMNKVKTYLVEHKKALIQKGLIALGAVAAMAAIVLVTNRIEANYQLGEPEEATEVVPESTPEA